MKISLLTMGIAAICGATAQADDSADKDALASILAGLSGSWIELHSTSMNDARSGWQSSAGGPFSKFEVKVSDDRLTSHWNLANARQIRITLAPGSYRTSTRLKDGSYSDMVEDRLVAAEIRSPQDWRFWLLHGGNEEGAPHECSEVYMAGDIFVWSNWMEATDGRKQRVRYAVMRKVDNPR